MRVRVWMFGAVAIGLCSGCSPSTPPSLSKASSDGGQSKAEDPCGEGYNLCQYRCCPDGTQCVNGECEYPYSSAHLFVYLCPDFSTGDCNSNFFQIDQMCSPLGPDAIGGTCYDTGLEVGSGRTYGLATCQECSSNCSRPSSFNTPPGFLGREWHSGFGFFCHQMCDVPPSCGGRSSGGNSGGSGGSGASGSTQGSGSSSSQNGGASDGGGVPIPTDAGSDASAAGGPGLCAVSAAGECVKCTGFDDPTCGAETCCQLDGLGFCHDLTVAACIGCTSDGDCDPGVHCCR